MKKVLLLLVIMSVLLSACSTSEEQVDNYFKEVLPALEVYENNALEYYGAIDIKDDLLAKSLVSIARRYYGIYLGKLKTAKVGGKELKAFHKLLISKVETELKTLKEMETCDIKDLPDIYERSNKQLNEIKELKEDLTEYVKSLLKDVK